MFFGKIKVRSLAVLALAVSCPACESKTTPPSPVIAQKVETDAAIAAPGAPDVVQALRSKQLADLKPPPLTPPADARLGSMGIKWRTVLPGTGRAPESGDQVQEEVSVWKSDGTLIFSTYQTPGSYTFPADGLPAPFLAEIRKLKAGARAQFWIPKSAMVAGKSQSTLAVKLPDEDLIVEGEILQLEPRPPAQIFNLPSASNPTANDATRPSPPDAAGPPKGALATTSGLRFVRLVLGTGTSKPARDQRVHLLLTAWPVGGLVVREPILRDYLSTTTPARSPKGISEIVSSMVEGETRRVWLTPQLGREIASTDGTIDVVLDMTLQSIE